MKSIKIQINRLGAVQNSTLELKPLMIFSGESGLGKSYVAILVHYFYKLLAESRLQGFFNAEGWDYESLINLNSDEGTFTVTTDKLLSWINEDAKAYMRQAVGNDELNVDVTFDIPFTKQEYSFRYSKALFGIEGKEELTTLFQLDNTSMRLGFEADVKSIGSLPWSMLLQDALRSDLLEENRVNQTFAMVPGRGALLNIPVTLQERVKSAGDIYSEFLTDWYVVRSMPRKKTDETLVSLLYDINGGRVEIDENDRVVYRTTDDALLPISAAASSIKELAPLYMLLDKYPAEQLSILFEEPEAHLHPKKQVDIADFVVRAINKGSHMQITTHSDYFLRRLNDRIFLHKIQVANEEVYAETLSKFAYYDLTINPSLIGAYLLYREEDGSVKVVPQSLEKGIPYESFYDVIKKEARHSLDIQQTYYKLAENHAE